MKREDSRAEEFLNRIDRIKKEREDELVNTRMIASTGCRGRYFRQDLQDLQD